MNVETITMDQEEAQAKLDEYRDGLQRRVDQEWKAAAEGFEALVEGYKLINLDRVIAAGGFFDDMRPKLAVARADRDMVRFRWRGTQEHAEFYSGSDHWSTRWLGMLRTVHLGQLHNQWARDAAGQRLYVKDIEGYTMVPMVPPEVRRQAKGALKDYWTLWEVEKWFDRNPKEPPVDPYLLRHVGGSLYAVVAEWDLTDLERAVMQQRAQ